MCGVAKDVTVNDFMSGLIATCATRGISTLSLRGDAFFEAMKAAYEALRAIAPSEGLELRFRIILDEIYGDSPTVREAISTAVQRNLISLDNPEYQDMRVKFGRYEADKILAGLPGRPEVYAAVTDAYLEHERVSVA